ENLGLGENEYEKVWDSSSDASGHVFTSLGVGNLDGDGFPEIVGGTDTSYDFCGHVIIFENVADDDYDVVTDISSVETGGWCYDTYYCEDDIQDDQDWCEESSPYCYWDDWDGWCYSDDYCGDEIGDDKQWCLDSDPFCYWEPDYSCPGEITDIETADMDEDDTKNIIFSTDGSSVYDFESVADNDYEQKWSSNENDYTEGYAVSSISIGDQDGDGNLEIFAGTPYDDLVFSFENTAGRYYLNYLRYLLEYFPINDVEIADSDGDGLGEFITGTYGYTTLRIFEAYNDIDFDGVADEIDNCEETPNADQADSDEDGVGNVCDNCVDISNPDQADSNGNGIGDACDTGGGTPASGGTGNIGNSCSNSWDCSGWSDCQSDGTQTRSCNDVGNCPGSFASPETSRGCTYIAPAATGGAATTETESEGGGIGGGGITGAVIADFIRENEKTAGIIGLLLVLGLISGLYLLSKRKLS
ncbi:MAG: hypothetical protein AABY07_11075, partial [Nanoarchaeota archaeon]